MRFDVAAEGGQLETSDVAPPAVDLLAPAVARVIARVIGRANGQKCAHAVAARPSRAGSCASTSGASSKGSTSSHNAAQVGPDSMVIGSK